MDEENKINVDDTLKEHTSNSSNNLTKYERKLIKKQQREEEQKQRIDDSNKKDRKNTIIKYSIIAVVLLVVIIFANKLFVKSDSFTGSTTLDIEVNEKVKGNPDAPVTILEYSDFECPYCKRFVDDTLPSIEREYISTGKVKFVYNHFPLRSIHYNAQSAAEASECANEQGKFWKYHDILFQNSPRLKENNLLDYATQIGLDTEKFKECLSSGKYESVVEKELREGSKFGVTGTPGFIINGKLITGAQPFSVFKQAIDSNLQ